MSPEEFERLMRTANPDALTLALALMARVQELEQRVAELERRLPENRQDAVTYGVPQYSFALPE